MKKVRIIKVLQINSVYDFGSTGRIVAGIQNKCNEKDVVCWAAYRYAEENTTYSNTFTVSSWIDCHVHNRIDRITWKGGLFSYFHTKEFIKRIEKENFDVIHLHNLHGNYINLRLLFKFIKKHNIKTIWTLHDCWSFTGHCPYFDMIGCDKWKTGCYDCPQFSEAFGSIFDSSKKMWKLKKTWFTGVENMTIVTPSNWLAGLVKESFLKEYPVKVIHNGIDLSIFKPTPSNFRQKYNCDDKFILLGVAFGWGKRKGLDIFIELVKRLDERFQIVLVGTNEYVDAQLPENIISIHQTQNQQELAEIYTAADLFINPTREEVFGLVNAEALACGTPLVTFDTGGSPEVCDETCGIVVPKDDIEALVDAIYNVYDNKPFSKEACIERTKAFDKNDKFSEYVKLYEDGIK